MSLKHLNGIYPKITSALSSNLAILAFFKSWIELIGFSCLSIIKRNVQWIIVLFFYIFYNVDCWFKWVITCSISLTKSSFSNFVLIILFVVLYNVFSLIHSLSIKQHIKQNIIYSRKIVFIVTSVRSVILRAVNINTN